MTEPKIILEEGHANLHMEFLNRAMIYGGKDRELEPHCRARLEAAVKKIERIDEVSLGMWELVKYLRGADYVGIIVQADAEFLTKVGLEVDYGLFSLLKWKGMDETPIKILLGCVFCAYAFTAYCVERWGKEL